MRDTNRLYPFYNKLMEIHMTYFPDLRFSQLIINIQEYHSRNHNGADIFYLEEDEMIKLLEDYAHHITNIDEV
jgi:hypothetical protein